jgi:hypothetical protein
LPFEIFSEEDTTMDPEETQEETTPVEGGEAEGTEAPAAPEANAEGGEESELGAPADEEAPKAPETGAEGESEEEPPATE